MKHRRGIDLFPPVRAKPTRENFCIADVQEWYMLFGKCGSCSHTGHIDRWELGRKFGKERPFLDLMPQLLCRKCGNREKNSFCVSPIKR